MYLMKPYDDALHQILTMGVKKTSRTGISTLAVFGIQKRYNLEEGFPFLTGRELPFQAMIGELLWFISGSTNNNDLKKLGCNFWIPWVDENFEKEHGYASGCFGPVWASEPG